MRLKVVYDSRLTTGLRVGYQMELQPGIMDKYSLRNQESLKLTSWFNYLAYTADGRRDPEMKFGRYPVSDEGGWDADTVGTIEWARVHDRDHPYPGYPQPSDWYSQTEYSHRNFVKATLESSTDAAGMLVTQTLYDSEGGIKGEANSLDPIASFSRAKEVIHASEIVYSISGAVTNGANSLEALNARREQAAQEDPSSPYNSTTLRYYVLLPKGLKLNEEVTSHEIYNGEDYGSAGFLSPLAAFYNTNSPKVVMGGNTAIPVSKGNISGWRAAYTYGSTATSMFWGDYGGEGTVKLVSTQDVNGRQLVIFDRKIAWDTWTQFNMWEKSTFFWGRGLSFSAVPKNGTGSLPAGDYSADIWCQYLDDNGEALSMNQFQTEEQRNAAALQSAFGEGQKPAGDTLLYIPIGFTNRASSANSDGKIEVQITDSPKEGFVNSEGTYRYPLTYWVNGGSTKDVVLWCNIEQCTGGHTVRDHPAPEWQGFVQGVDLNGNTAAVYVRKETFDTAEYENGAEKSWLESKGWEKVEDPDNYSDWSEVKAVAFSFEGQTFNSTDKPTVYIDMKAPEDSPMYLHSAGGDIQKTPGKTVYTTYNELIISNVQLGENGNSPSRWRTNHVQVSMDTTPVTYELPSTGGGGTVFLYTAGLALSAAAAWALYQGLRRGRKAREGGSA